MLITCDGDWGAPAWAGLKIRALLPENASIPANKSTDTGEWRVFRFTRPRSGLSILQTVLDRLDRCQQIAPGPLLFFAVRPDDDTLAACAERLTQDPWLLDAEVAPDTTILQHMALGAGYTGHPMFIHYFRSLSYTDSLDPADVLAQLHTYMGPAKP